MPESAKVRGDLRQGHRKLFWVVNVKPIESLRPAIRSRAMLTPNHTIPLLKDYRSLLEPILVLFYTSVTELHGAQV